MHRVVVDPGVLISARLSGAGAPAELIRRWLGGSFDIVVSPLLLDELREVLRRPKFRRWLSSREGDSFVDFLEEHAIVRSDPPASGDPITVDPDDDYLVALARAAGAAILVSGDSDLLGFADPMITMLTPRGFLDGLDQADADREGAP